MSRTIPDDLENTYHKLLHHLDSRSPRYQRYRSSSPPPMRLVIPHAGNQRFRARGLLSRVEEHWHIPRAVLRGRKFVRGALD
jgi:hypothetical protein